MGSLRPYDVLALHQYWRMVTVMFLHLDLLHIAFNMWALWVIGEYVEGILGHLKFLVLYLISGLAGSVLIVYAAPLLGQTVGASGAIFGIFGALAIYAFINRNRDFASRANLGQIVFLLILNLALTFGAGGISWQGHVGGLAGGTALMAGYMLLGRKNPGGRFTEQRHRLHGGGARADRGAHVLARADLHPGELHPLVVAARRAPPGRRRADGKETPCRQQTASRRS